jgi:hypothetical protein
VLFLFHQQKQVFMKNRMYSVDPKLLQPLSQTEAMKIAGGKSLIGILIDFAGNGVVYFFNMGLREGRRMRALI